MRIRILCTVYGVCADVKLFRCAFYHTSDTYATMVIHGLLYLEGQVNCTRLGESWTEDGHQQRLVHFLNHGYLDVRALNTRRVEQLLPFALQHRYNRKDCLQDDLLVSIDPSAFKKYKNKRMQGVHDTRDAKGGYKAQTFVMRSFISGQRCVPFKKMLLGEERGS